MVMYNRCCAAAVRCTCQPALFFPRWISMRLAAAARERLRLRLRGMPPRIKIQSAAYIRGPAWNRRGAPWRATRGRLYAMATHCPQRGRVPSLSVVPLFLALPHSARFISPSPPFLRRSAAAAPPSATGTEESRSGAGGPTVAELAGTTLSGIVHRAAWHFGGHIWRVCGALGRGGRPMTQFTNFNLLTYSSTCKKVSQSSNSNSSYLHTYYLPYDGCLGRNGLVGITLCSTAPCRLRPPPTAR